MVRSSLRLAGLTALSTYKAQSGAESRHGRQRAFSKRAITSSTSSSASSRITAATRMRVVSASGSGDGEGAVARGRRVAVAALLVALFVLHQDVWLLRDPRLVLGLPIGLAYHVAFCLVVTLVLALAVRWSWPREVSPAGDGGAEGSD
jgi:hypothetical protein